ncbi:cytochrome c3 family protein [Abyssalbus ytuae]|uniref:C-type cytochrome n=1 Tax=Abyssalbus ytuae TaxID=2926907 RepID=A0A9E6ZR80_9FLAO|nr:c-type cytochrome [Abyssalbus ytuae]UOB19010.1 c-type cytochrome [Abyssalbus ytuae]
MKKGIHRNSISRILGIGFAFLLSLSTSLFAQDGDPAKGKALFNANCAACHNLDKKMTGPALRGVGDKYEREWLYNWIHNSSAMVKAGDPQAVAVFEEYNGSVMTPFPQLSNEDIDNIIAYTMQPKAEPAAPAGGDVASGAGSGQGSSGISNNVILVALALVFALLIVMLFLVTKTLKRIAEASGVEFAKVESEKRLPVWKAFVKNQFLVLVTAIFFLLASAYFVYGYFMQVGVDQGYQPVQPIHFSHKIHAGDNQIDCKYCHSSARVSKHSGIPSLNVCMNCHKNISDYNGEVTAEHTKEFYDGEIQKLYAAVGWDASNQAYTGNTKPVKWIRIHNLPDFVYFNHSQHVEVAGLECQKCHGPIEEMEVVYQYSPLTMGWCVNCHRETNIKVEDNAYYEKIHAELSKKYGVDKLTAAQMGGLECGKCHY